MDDDREDEQTMVPLPERFWSFETDGLIESCLVCGGHLLEEEAPYLIEKAFSKGEVVFEYGLCLGCHGDLVRELSEASLERIRNHFVEQVHFEARRQRIAAGLDGTADPWLSHCLLTGQPINPGGEYQIFGMCLGDRLMLGDLPHALSGEAIGRLMELLSPETRGFLNDFTGKYFGAPTGADLPTLLPV
jgi:hypothetical protein